MYRAYLSKEDTAAHKGTVGVLQLGEKGKGGMKRVILLYSHYGEGVDSENQLLFAMINFAYL